MNALVGMCRPGDMGVDVIHLNLHKTFSTPHGGGGPGSGPVAVNKKLEPYLPIPVVVRKNSRYALDYDRPKTIGRIRSFYGNFLICVRAYAYILAMGGNGLRRASATAVVNANYLKSKLRKHYYLAYDAPCLHECVFSDKHQRRNDITALDIAKRLIDYGYHPPTIYFPLVVDGALMIEPTETESRQTLDQFIEAMIAIAEESEYSPDFLHSAPMKSKITRVDEVSAARNPVLRWNPHNGID